MKFWFQEQFLSQIFVMILDKDHTLSNEGWIEDPWRYFSDMDCCKAGMMLLFTHKTDHLNIFS